MSCHASGSVPLEAEEARRLGVQACRELVVLLGAPNSGKSALFNSLTGSWARVGNWPGVTVDVHVAGIEGGACLVDLPGVYGLGVGSIEERVAKEALARLKPGRVVVVLDGTAPERSLYLLVSALEAVGGKALVAVTKHALSHAMGVHIDVEGLRRRLGVPVVETSALEGVGLDRLRGALREPPRGRPLRVDYGLAEEAVSRLASHPEAARLSGSTGLSERWLAAQLLAGDPDVEALAEAAGARGLLEAAEEARGLVASTAGLEPALLVAEARVRAAEELARAFIVRRRPRETPRLDRLFLHPVAGPIAGLAVVFSVFLAAFTVNTGFPLNVVLAMLGAEGAAAALEEHSLTGLIAAAFGALKGLLPEGAWWAGLAAGAIDGVGLVASFIPLIAALVAFMALLDDSGLLTRIAVSFHPLFSRFGLTGRSLYPLLVGLGCNVPGVMLTRTLSPEERVRAIAALPFIPCSARLVVIAAFTYAFMEGVLERALAATGVYAVSIAAGLATARLVARLQRARLDVEEKPELVMELPMVHRPSLKVVWWATRDALAAFARKMAGPILAGAVLIWALVNYGPSGQAASFEESYGYMVGRVTGAVFEPILGGDPTAALLGVAVVAGSLVKEVIVETIGVAVGVPDPAAAVAALGLSKAQAFAILLFTAMYVPCIGTMTAIYAETGSLRRLAAQAAYMIALATLVMYAAYAALEALA